ncbi:hypothetical protein FKM82_001958 [Ascaphus truei]
MPALRFSANLSWLFQHVPDLPGRVQAAAGAGFQALEVAWPYDSDVGLLREALDRHQLPMVLINTPPAVSILQKVGRPNLKLQMDLYHWQIMDGNLTQNMKTYFPLIGHVQIAQVPHRNEPDSPGELNFMYLFDLLEELGYQDYVGCEYKPQGDTLTGLGWMETYRKRCNIRDKTE